MSHPAELLPEMLMAAPHAPLGVVAGYSTTRVNASDLDGTSFVGVDNLLPNKGGRLDATYAPNSARLTAYEKGDVLLGNIRPYLRKIWLATKSGGCSGDVLALRVRDGYRRTLDPGFLYQVLASEKFFAYNVKHARGAKMPRGSRAEILNFRIPLPPLDAQREIVRILDQFSQLEAELEAELEARRRQYSHYRKLLIGTASAGIELEMSQLISGISSGRNILRLEDGAYPVYGSTGRLGATDTPIYDGEALLIARVGANAGRVTAVSGQYDVTDNTLIATLRSDVWDLRFAFHQLTAMNLNQFAVGGGQPLITGRLLKGLRLTVPPLDEQQHVAGVLDKFDALVNDLSIGLPAELAARRKQYEYYRDKLLTFEEALA